MIQKIKNWLNVPNEEGIDGKTCLIMMIMPVLMFLFFINLSLWMMKPEQEWIGRLLFPFK